METCGLNTKVKVSGNWETVTAKHVKVSSGWQTVKKSYAKVSGSWVETFVAERSVRFSKSATPVTTGNARVYAAPSVDDGYGVYTDIDLSTYFTTDDKLYDCRVIVDSDVYIIGSSTTNYALKSGSSYNRTITLENNGNILGRGGDGGEGGSVESTTYVGSYTGTYVGSYTGSYSGAYIGAYGGAYTGSYIRYYSGQIHNKETWHTNDVSGTDVYVGSGGMFTVGFTGAYTGSYIGSYTGSYGGGYVGSYSGGYTGNYTHNIGYNGYTGTDGGPAIILYSNIILQGSGSIKGGGGGGGGGGSIVGQYRASGGGGGGGQPYGIGGDKGSAIYEAPLGDGSNGSLTAFGNGGGAYLNMGALIQSGGGGNGGNKGNSGGDGGSSLDANVPTTHTTFPGGVAGSNGLDYNLNGYTVS